MINLIDETACAKVGTSPESLIALVCKDLCDNQAITIIKRGDKLQLAIVTEGIKGYDLVDCYLNNDDIHEAAMWVNTANAILLHRPPRLTDRIIEEALN